MSSSTMSRPLEEERLPASPFPPHPESKLTEEDLKKEEEHFVQVIAAFASHETHSERLLKKYWNDFASLSADQRALLSTYREKILFKASQCTRINQRFYNLVIQPHRHLLSSTSERSPQEPAASLSPDRPSVVKLETTPTLLDQTEAENLRSLLRQVMRDWSPLGRSERDACYTPILDRLQVEFPSADARGNVSVLVPGAGLGRLAYEISQLGFTCQGNEFSLFMLLTAELFLARSGELERESLQLCPFVFPFSNIVRLEDQLRIVNVPDITVQSAPADFSMVAGDFLDVYAEQEAVWDAIVTCYFVDTAKNIVDYMTAIHRLLVPQGVWINNGPLLYHFEGHAKEPSIELCVEELRALMEHLGFVIDREEFLESTYAQNPASMHQTIYRTWSFTAHKL